MSEFRISGKSRIRFQQRLGSSWKDLADYLEVEPHVSARWRQGDEPRELWEFLRLRRRLGELPAALAEIKRHDLIPLLETPPVPPRRSRRKLIRAAAGVVLVLGVVAGLGAWRWTRDHPMPGYVKLQSLPAPTAVTWGADLTCPARTQWPHSFPQSFVGDVYVQFTADPRRQVTVRASLFWGGRTWSQTVPSMPGDMDKRAGGTLLVFQKRGVDRDNPEAVSFETDIPVCATFGTGSDAAKPAPSLELPTPRWS
ncbi:hypothetical protein [Actinoplanes sp. NPDC026670]|uniref:hypothetical protein n=1 Tax=Actinoplanes sp. NPDC026670 TaxID=3154700 RepID=UPI0033E16FA5